MRPHAAPAPASPAPASPTPASPTPASPSLAAPSQAALEAAAVGAAIESLQGTLRIAAALLLAGRTLDLDGLEGDAARLCLAVGLLPAADAAALRPALEALLHDLDRLAGVLAPPDDED
jgi:hypothetical protein